MSFLRGPALLGGGAVAGPAPTFVGVSPFTGSPPAITAGSTFPVPAHAADDLIIAFIRNRTGTTAPTLGTSETGWADVFPGQSLTAGIGDTCQSRVLWKRDTAGTISAISTAGASGLQEIAVLVYRGVTSIGPAAVSPNTVYNVGVASPIPALSMTGNSTVLSFTNCNQPQSSYTLAGGLTVRTASPAGSTGQNNALVLADVSLSGNFAGGSYTPGQQGAYIVNGSIAMMGGAASGGSDDPLWTFVQLLMHCNGTDGAGGFIDSSAVGRTLTASGGAVHSGAQSMFGGSAAALNGTSAFISTANVSGLNLSGTDFCIEGWLYLTRATGEHTIIDFRGSGADNSSWNLFVDAANRCIGFYDGPSAGIFKAPNNSNPANGTWFHFAVTRASGTLRIFVDGAQVASWTYNPPATHSSGVRIGTNQNATFFLQGFIDELRVTVGAARYTAAFTRPSAAFPDLTGGGASTTPPFGGTVLLLEFDGSFNDTSGRGHSVSPNYSLSTTGATLTSAQFRFGGQALQLDGTTYLEVTDTDGDFQVGTGDYTVEFWLRIAAAPAATPQLYFGGIQAMLTPTRALRVYSDGSAFTDSAAGVVPLNTWAHIAVVRSGSSLVGYVNGAAVVSITATPASLGAAAFRVGGVQLAALFDRFQVHRFAKYTGAFNPGLPATHALYGAAAVQATAAALLQNGGPASGGAFGSVVNGYSGFALATVQFCNDGRVLVRDDSGMIYAGQWYSPTTAGIGAGYWVRVVKTSGPPLSSGSPLSTWVSLSEDRAWTYSVSGDGQSRIGYFDWQVATNSTGSAVVASGTFQLIAQTAPFP